MTRQVERQNDREEAKHALSMRKAVSRKDAKRALLERQTEREKSGFYTGSVAKLISPSRSRVTKRRVRKTDAFGRIIFKQTVDGREISFHATKGWRSHRA